MLAAYGLLYKKERIEQGLKEGNPNVSWAESSMGKAKTKACVHGVKDVSNCTTCQPPGSVYSAFCSSPATSNRLDSRESKCVPRMVGQPSACTAVKKRSVVNEQTLA